MMNNTDFAVFILTHGRPDNVVTYKSLKRHGYTGKIYIIVDNEDKTIDRYKELYGDKVIVFDKLEISKTFDEGDNFDDRRSIVYARNACFNIAKELGITYFMELDDDYTNWQYRFNDEKEYEYKKITNLDDVLDVMIDYYKSIPALSIAMSQGGDWIGGKEASRADHLKLWRKAMNTFICSTDREFQFVGRINEDVNTYTKLASTGGLFLTIPNVSIVQKQTQTSEGGMSDIYIDKGTYIKSFYSIIFHPSSVCIRMMGDKNRRLHHSVTWNNTVPKILDEKYKK